MCMPTCTQLCVFICFICNFIVFTCAYAIFRRFACLNIYTHICLRVLRRRSISSENRYYDSPLSTHVTICNSSAQKTIVMGRGNALELPPAFIQTGFKLCRIVYQGCSNSASKSCDWPAFTSLNFRFTFAPSQP